MTQFFILPENIEPSTIDDFLSRFDKFLSEILPDWNGDFSSCVTEIDEKFIQDHAEGFMELREIGTVGLSKKYGGRYYIAIYDNDIPYWVCEAIRDVTHSQLIQIKEKRREEDWR